MIVVADDDPVVQQTCRHCLEAAGYEVMVFDSGVEAVRAVANGEVSIVFLDVFMPDMDGLETLLSIKKKRPSTPVVVMTGGGARVRLDFLEAATKFGADGVMRKPFTAQQLVSIIEPLTKNICRL
jgi:two-component system response regulator CpxR